MASQNIPKTMKAVIFNAPDEKLVFKDDVPVPVPKSGQVLVKVMASPINPSDLGFLKGYSQNKLPVPGSPGFEGAGLVVQSGGGMLGWYLKGKKVSFSTGQGASNGAWAEYAAVDAKLCIAQNNDIDYDVAACAIINPLTVLAMIDLVKDKKYKGIIHTAAASQLGKMMVKLCQENKIPLINIVRRQEQVDILKKEVQAEYVLNSEDQNFDEDLKQLCDKLNANCFFDAVSGKQTTRILNKMPNGSIAYIYGALSFDGVHIDPSDLIFRRKQVKGFVLPEYIQQKGLIWTYNAVSQVQKFINSKLKSTIAKQFSFEQSNEALEFYLKNMTAGKVVLKPEVNQASVADDNDQQINYQKQ